MHLYVALLICSLSRSELMYVTNNGHEPLFLFAGDGTFIARIEPGVRHQPVTLPRTYRAEYRWIMNPNTKMIHAMPAYAHRLGDFILFYQPEPSQFADLGSAPSSRATVRCGSSFTFTHRYSHAIIALYERP